MRIDAPPDVGCSDAVTAEFMGDKVIEPMVVEMAGGRKVAPWEEIRGRG